MRKIITVSVLALAAAALTACSQEPETDVVATPSATGSAMAGESTTAAAASAVLDANTATEAQLAAAPGMTPELASAIVAGRPYAGVSALNAKLLETMPADAAATALTGVFVPVNLNSASRADIALIPGMSDRMIGEFLEYRPYADMAEFDREIGKYVDAAEVARFRNYVTL